MKKEKQTVKVLVLGLLFALLLIPHAPAEAKSVKITLSAAGDCTLGVDTRYYNTFNNYYNNNNAAYFLKGVKSVFKNDDVTIVNMEGTLTTSTNRANKEFTFKGPAKYAKILKKGSVEVVNLANNHTMDFGSQGYSDTKKNLKAKGIKYCGGSKIAYKKVNGVRMAFIGLNALNGVTNSQVKKMVKTAKKDKASIIVVSFHWGTELAAYPSAQQQSLAHAAIDAGATLVLGHHPHVLQGVEKYKGRYIVYSLGNFCFGGNTNPSDKDTMIFQQTFTVKSNGEVKVNDNVRVIPCSISSVSYVNDYQPTILTGSEKSRVLSKINSRSSMFGVSFKSSGKVRK